MRKTYWPAMAAALAVAPLNAQAQDSCTEVDTMCYLGAIDPGRDSEALAVSADGSVVVGYSGTSSGGRAFRWTSASGMENLGLLPNGRSSSATDVSGDGSVVVGWGTSGGLRAWRWTAQDGMTTFLPGTNSSQANGISQDGLVIVGEDNFRPFRWSATDGVTDLGIFEGDMVGAAQDTSADGAVVVGYSRNTNNGQSRAFRWTAQDGKDHIGGIYGFAYGVSADGTIVVGSNNGLAFRWTQDGGAESLGALPGGTNSFAYDISADGTTIVGSSASTDGRYAFRWTEQDQMVSLGVLEGGVESYAYGVSGDGSVVVGYSETTEGDYRAFLWRSGAMQDHSNLIASFSDLGSQTDRAFAAQQAWARMVMDDHVAAPAAGKSVISAFGGGLAGNDLGGLSFGHGLSETVTIGLTFAGAAANDLGPDLSSTQDRAIAAWGSFNQNGAAGTGLAASFAIGNVSEDVSITRGAGYADVQAANGLATVETQSHRIGLRYAIAQPSGWLLIQHASLTRFATTRSSYAEDPSATAFSASYAAMDQTSLTGSFGLRGDWETARAQRLGLGAGADVDLARQAQNLSGTANVPAMDRFDLPSTLARNAVRPYVSARLDLDLPAGGQISADLHGARPIHGRKPMVGLRLRYQIAF